MPRNVGMGRAPSEWVGKLIQMSATDKKNKRMSATNKKQITFFLFVCRPGVLVLTFCVRAWGNYIPALPLRQRT